MAGARQQGRGTRKDKNPDSVDEKLRRLGEEILNEDVPEFLRATLRRAAARTASEPQRPDEDGAAGPNRKSQSPVPGRS